MRKVFGTSQVALIKGSTLVGASVGSTSKTEAWSPADGILIDSAQEIDKQAFAYMSSNGLESDYYNFVAGNSNTWDSSMLSFTDLFNDNVVDLGVYDIWGIGYGTSVDVTFQWTTSDATTSFSGKFAAGFSAVPESSSIMFLLSVGLGYYGFGRRRNCS